MSYNKKAFLFIYSSRRNLFCSLIDPVFKKVIISWSLGSLEKVKWKKSISLGSSHIGEFLSEKLTQLGYNSIFIYSRGLGKGNISFIRSITKSGLHLICFIENTELSHNGCRPSKLRRKKNKTHRNDNMLENKKK
ncbi:unnamed protein product [Choristocarpus tenellus]|uniref:ribosomal protein S11 n=1 Tax=Choristocarpus tenellus TaxID=116065 RepID=UPI002E760BB2|nr:ribosomal protein S11 [Choristocarpus tenellus]WBP69816.1 ribosomal protein S11 [Choristocarpus tenellus]